MDRETRFCKFCGVDHPLTSDFWHYISGLKCGFGKCKIKEKTKRQNRTPEQKKRHNEATIRWHNKKMKTDLQYRLRCILRIRFNRALRKNYKAGSAVRDLGCSVGDLVKYIERLFSPGMSWDNYGKWHIDHIKPLVSFDLTDRKQIKKALNYTNLQPLWAVDNLSKGSK